MRLHPMIRVLVLLIVAGFLPFLPPAALLGTALILGLFYWLHPATDIRGPVRMLRRLRWFFLSIVVLYLWFTPGMPVLPYEDWWLPTQEGVVTGIDRCLVLALMVAAVYVLLQTTSREQLTGALRTLVVIFKPLGLDPDRFARRLVLSLQAVPGIQSLVEAARDSRPNRNNTPRRLAEIAAGLVRAVEHAAAGDAVQSPAQPTAPESARPAWWQWGIPAALLAACLAALHGIG